MDCDSHVGAHVEEVQGYAQVSLEVQAMPVLLLQRAPNVSCVPARKKKEKHVPVCLRQRAPSISFASVHRYSLLSLIFPLIYTLCLCSFSIELPDSSPRYTAYLCETELFALYCLTYREGSAFSGMSFGCEAGSGIPLAKLRTEQKQHQ